MIVAITGARKGIGKAMAKHFLAGGHTVFGCSRKESDIASERYFHHNIDIADEKAVKAFFTDIRRRAGRLDVLINNAGEAAMNHLLLTPKATFSRLFESNVVGTFLCTREGARLLKRSTVGRVINLSSIAVPLRLEGAGAYAASKSAVVHLTETLSKELAPLGITINAIGPAPIATSMVRTVPKDTIDRLIERQTIKRMGSMDDVINVVEFFINPRSNFVTGQTIYLGGVVS